MPAATASFDESPASSAGAVTLNDMADLPSVARALYIGVSGDVTVDMAVSGTGVLFTGVPVGILPIRVRRVYSTGTSASRIVALY